MSSTDDRIVKMQFDNAQFKKGALETKQSLADVNKAIDASGKGKGLLDLNANMQRVQVSASKMAIVTTTALATITNKAVNAGLSLAKSLTFDPIRQGFSEYEAMLTKQNVIQNATGKSARVVKGYLNQLNTYSDKTVYSFGNMTDAIQKFVNAGVPLKTSVTSIKGIANAAAFAGASSEEANRAMYAFSQSMSLGFIQLQDWNQIENANLGTVKFKNTLLEAGAAAGTLTKKGNGYLTQTGKYVSATKGWRDGLQEQWATTEVLNTALGKYADTSTNLGKKAFQAATQVRTFSAFMDTLKESIGSGWSQIFTALIGNLGQSTKMWTGLSQAIGGVVSDFFNFGEETLKTWRKMGGFQKTLQGFKNLLSPIAALFGAIGAAYREAFPSSGKGAGKALYGISAGFEAITRPLTLLADLITATTPGLAIFFKIIKLGGIVVGRVAGGIADFVTDMIGVAELKPPGNGGFLGFIKDIGKAIGNAVDQIDDLLSKGASLKEAFGSVDISLPSIPNIPSMGSLFGSGGTKGDQSQVVALTGGVKDLTKNVLGLKGAAEDTSKTAIFNPKSKLDTSRMSDFAGSMKDAASSISSSGDDVETVGDKVGGVLGKMKDVIGDFVSGITLKDVVSGANLALLGTFMISISRFVNTLTKSFKGFAGLGESVNGVLESASAGLKSLQTQARAKLILNIAIAVGILAASLWVLSRIPADKLATGLAALGAIFFMLNVTMKTFGASLKATDGVIKGVNMVAMAASITLLAFAMILLATACLIMNKVEWQSIAKGIITMYAAMKVMETLGEQSKMSAKNMVAGAAAIAIMAGSMIILAGALLLFQLVKWESMGKAGAVLAGLTIAVGALALIPYEGIAKVGLALLGASVGMLAIANALIIFALVKWESIGKAAVVLTALTLSLAVIMAVGGPASAAAMLGLAGALLAVALACIVFNHVDWQSIGKATVALTVLLLAFAVGAAILTVFLYAITPVAPVLIILAAGFFLLGLGLLAFAGAMAIAITLGAAGVAAFATLATGAAVAVAVFMQTLASEAPILKDSFLQILQSLIDTIVEAVPMIIQGVKDLWAAVKKEFTSPDKGKATGDAGKGWMEKLGDGIKKMMPKIAAIAVDLFGKFLKALDKHLPEILTMGLYFVTKLIQGITKRLPAIIDAATDLIIAFARGLEKSAAKLANAGIDLIATFLHDLADAIRGSAGKIGGGITDVIDAFRDVGVQMIKGMIEGIASIDIKGAIENIADSLPGWARKILQIHSPSRVFANIGKFIALGLTKGIQDYASSAIRAVASMVSGQIATASSYISKYIQQLDQQSAKARGMADGLADAAAVAAAAADRQQKKADKTKKNKKDDKRADQATKAANAISKAADKADKAATAAEARSQAAKDKQDRADQFEDATLLEKAQMRSEDAQTQIDNAKAAERRAAADLAEANALDKQAKAKGVSAKERKQLEKAADAARKKAKEEAKKANDWLAEAKLSAADALKYQTKAGEEAAQAFQDQFDAEAKADADADAYEKLTDAEKAKKRREDAAILSAKAAKDLEDAKKLAYTDLEAANELAAQAMEEADLARQYIDDALDLEGTAPTTGTVLNLDPSIAASEAFNRYSEMYDAAVAAAASGGDTTFNQYNTSPESLPESTIYRNTNNLFSYAADRLQPVA